MTPQIPLNTSQVCGTGRSGGFTMVEVVFVVAVMGLIFSTVGPILVSNSDLAADTRAHQRAEASHHQNMAALVRVLRGVDIRTLSGFDAEGVALQPGFGRVTGADLDDLTYAGSERLTWMPNKLGVDGVEKPGAIYLQHDGSRTLIADRVPAGQFFVRQEGQNLVIHLSTYYATSQSRVVTKTSESVVSVRN